MPLQVCLRHLSVLVLSLIQFWYTVGNPTDKTQAEEKREHAAEEYNASQAGARVGPYSFSSTGEVTKDNEDRRQGSWDETVGSVKKAVGNLTGSTSLKVGLLDLRTINVKINERNRKKVYVKNSRGRPRRHQVS